MLDNLQHLLFSARIDGGELYIKMNSLDRSSFVAIKRAFSTIKYRDY